MNDWLNIEDYCCNSEDDPTYDQMCNSAKPEEFYYAIATTMDARPCVYFCPVAYWDAHDRFPDAFIDMSRLLADTGYRQYSYDELPLALTNDLPNVIRGKLGKLGFKDNEAFSVFCKEMSDGW